MRLLWVLPATAAVAAALGLFWLVRGLTSGRAVGAFGTADRASSPVLFWLNVAVIAGLVAVSSGYLAWAGFTSGAVPGTFRATHPVAVSGDATPAPVPRASAPGCDTPGPRVCFVAAGAAPDVSVEFLASYYSTLLGAPVGVLDPIPLPKQARGRRLVDPGRAQVGAGALIELVRETYPTLWVDRGTTILILTGNDLWVENHADWAFAFGSLVERRGGGGMAVVSSARMDPVAYGHAPDPARVERRVRSLIGKYVAILRYGERLSHDPSSPVFDPIQSLSDLDGMRPFAPPR
jgi:hypothetical protein